MAKLDTFLLMFSRFTLFCLGGILEGLVGRSVTFYHSIISSLSKPLGGRVNSEHKKYDLEWRASWEYLLLLRQVVLPTFRKRKMTIPTAPIYFLETPLSQFAQTRELKKKQRFPVLLLIALAL